MIRIRLQIKHVLPAEIALLSSMYSTAELKSMFNNEQVFIILLCRLYLGTSTKEEVEKYLSEFQLDSKAIWKIASVHNIRPILYHVIQEHQLSVEEKLLNKLKQYFIENQFRSLEQLAICHDVITSLKKEGIDAIPFKGTVFSEMYYSNSGLRESTDIDLFISSKDIAASQSVLQAKNFIPKLTVPSSYLNYYKKYFKEIVYTAPAKTRSGYSVELHWKLLNYYFGNYPGFTFFHTKTFNTNLKQLEFKVLNPTADFLAVVSNHFVKDLGVKFKYLVDIACLVSKSESKLDRRMIAQIADEFGCRKRIDTAFHLIEKVLGIRSNHYCQYKAEDQQTKTILATPLALNDFQVSNPRFLKRFTALQDNYIGKLKFLGRSAFYFFLPTDNDLNSFDAKKQKPLAVLIALRPFRLLFKAFSKRKSAD
jgi:hypothetical protein